MPSIACNHAASELKSSGSWVQAAGMNALPHGRTCEQHAWQRGSQDCLGIVLDQVTQNSRAQTGAARRGAICTGTGGGKRKTYSKGMLVWCRQVWGTSLQGAQGLLAPYVTPSPLQAASPEQFLLAACSGLLQVGLGVARYCSFQWHQIAAHDLSSPPQRKAQFRQLWYVTHTSYVRIVRYTGAGARETAEPLAPVTCTVHI